MIVNESLNFNIVIDCLIFRMRNEFAKFDRKCWNRNLRKILIEFFAYKHLRYAMYYIIQMQIQMHTESEIYL